jgi:hypothetical protein
MDVLSLSINGSLLRRPAAAFVIGFAAFAVTLPLTSFAQTATAPPQSQAKPPIALSFSQFFRMPIGSRGLELSDALLSAHGQQISINGYMVAQEQPRAGQFFFTPRPVRMSEHADGEADDLPPGTLSVMLSGPQRDRMLVHRDGRIQLTGTLSIGRFEDASGRVSWAQLTLPESALEALSSPQK